MPSLPPPSDAVRVAIVDDSRTIRQWLRRVFDDDGRFQVVGDAADAEAARDMLRRVDVDVLTLDINMPGISGLEFLRRIMERRPLPVVMLSSLTEYGSKEAVEAMSLGAVDCITRPSNALDNTAISDICERVWRASQTTVGQRTVSLNKADDFGRSDAQKDWLGDIILVGSSTGGVTALNDLLLELEGVDWPVVIAQHMPERFLKSLSSRFNKSMSRNFLLARDGLTLKANQAVFALGKTVSTILTRETSGHVVLKLTEPSENAEYRPSIDDLFRSAAYADLSGAAAVLTGMGDDGAAGLHKLKSANFLTFAQDQESCVVFGMPKAAAELGAVQEMLDPMQIGKRLAQHARSTST